MKDATQLAVFYQQLGDNIRVRRKTRNLSQDALAKLVGLTRTSLTNIESGRQHPPLHILCEIAAQLDVAVPQLLPQSLSLSSELDLGSIVGLQVRGDDELAFIRTGLGIVGGETNGDT